MQKIIAAAIAAAFLAPAAMAEVSIGGSIRTALDWQNLTDATDKNVKDFDENRLADQGSRIWFKGVDALDNGDKLIWKLEQGVMVGGVGGSTSNGQWGFREAWIAYESASLGNLRFGRQDNAYKENGKQFLPAIDANFNDDSGMQGGSQFTRRLGGRLGSLGQYETPNLSGFRARASYDMGPYATNGADLTYGDVGFTYKDKMFAVGGSWGQANDRKISFGKVDLGVSDTNAQVGTKISGFQLGGSFFYENFALSAAWENVTWDNGATSRDQDSVGVAASYKMDKFTFLGQYGWAGDVSGLSETGGQQVSVGVRYSLSKQASVNLTYAQVNNDANAAFKTESPATSLKAGQTQQVVTVGTRVDF